MFRNMNFKYTDAEEEAIYAPELIESAYVDINLILKEIKEPSKFLVIGPKGSGKTALSEKLKLLSDKTCNLDFQSSSFKLIPNPMRFSITVSKLLLLNFNTASTWKSREVRDQGLR